MSIYNTFVFLVSGREYQADVNKFFDKMYIDLFEDGNFINREYVSETDNDNLLEKIAIDMLNKRIEFLS